MAALPDLLAVHSSPAVRLMLFARAVEAWSPERAAKHKRDGKGRFTKGSGVSHALSAGDEEALGGMSREQLRREARSRGISLKRGASLDEIKDALWDHHNGQKDDEGDDDDEAAEKPAAKRADSNLRAAQERQERIDVQRAASIVAAEVDEMRHKGADLELIQERLMTHAALLTDSPQHTRKGRRADLDDLAGQLRGLAGAKSVDAIQSDLRAMQDDLGVKPVGKAGEKVSFDPAVHEPLAGDPQPGSQVEIMRPGSRSDDGTLLERPVVSSFLASVKPEATETPGSSPTPAMPRDRVLTEIAGLAKQPSDLVSLARLRTRMPELSHDEFTTLLKKMDRERIIQLDPDPNRKALPPEAHAAAIQVGGEDKHLVSTLGGPPIKAKSVAASPPAPTAKPAPAPIEATAGEPVAGAKSTTPVIVNNWGGGDAEVSYHPDGAIGRTLRTIGDDALMDVGGEPLANVLGRMATDVTHGRVTPQANVGRIRALVATLPEGNAKFELTYMVDGMDVPEIPRVQMPAGSPPVLQRLTDDLTEIPVVRKDQRELKAVRELAQRIVDGQVSPRRAAGQLRDRVANGRHESASDEGKNQIDSLIHAAADALETAPRLANQ